MADFDENLQIPDDFQGMVRLFPLPQFVLFPGVGQMLHVFEPRYREMTDDSLNSDRLIGMAQLYPDQIDERGNPRISETICVGRILTEVKAEDGRYNLFLVGVSRGRMIREIDSEKPYRIGEVDLLPSPPVDESHFAGARQRLLDIFLGLESLGQLLDEETLAKFRDESVPISRLTDMIAYAVGFDTEQKQLVLDTHDIVQRIALVEEMLLGFEQFLRQKSTMPRDFPPKFSDN